MLGNAVDDVAIRCDKNCFLVYFCTTVYIYIQNAMNIKCKKLSP